MTNRVGDELRRIRRFSRRLRAGEGLRGRPAALDLAGFRSRFTSEPTTVLEIGANNGSDTVRLLETFGSATIHCFEPDPRALAMLRARVTSERAHIHPFAISDADGHLEFFQSGGAPPGSENQFSEGWHYSSSIRRPTGHLEEFPWCTFDTTIEVRSVRLDTWFEQQAISSIDFIWADVQGAEGDLIAGGRTALAHTRFLYTEFSDVELYEGQKTLGGLLEMLPGWRIAQRFRSDVLLENTAFRPA